MLVNSMKTMRTRLLTAAALTLMGAASAFAGQVCTPAKKLGPITIPGFCVNIPDPPKGGTPLKAPEIDAIAGTNQS